MSFQIIDDVLDFTASPEELGKPTGSDLIQGNITLPIHFAMKHKAFREVAIKQIGNKQVLTEEDVAPVLSELKKTDAIEASYQMSEQYLAKALRATEGLESSKAKSALVAIANTIGKRKS